MPKYRNTGPYTFMGKKPGQVVELSEDHYPVEGISFDKYIHRMTRAGLLEEVRVPKKKAAKKADS